ncbi:MAG TPA: autotransporter-associated beta strand repeat-containing protein [Tepidisphaeraceae bacterium]|nr:autotransporter-associated beta strand repeat-containing protein [Tepidisphaeraceae bacterium]
MKKTWRNVILAAILPVLTSRAEDIEGPQPAALDQPQINAALTVGGPAGAGNVLVADFGFGITTINITAYLDTGASGVLISSDTADALNLAHDTYNGQTIVYSDVGVAGSDNFHVSQPIYVNLAPFTPSTDGENIASYTQAFGPLRTQIGPLNQTDPNLAGLDVLGTPVMHNKVVVIDPRPANTFVDTSRVTLYDPGDSNIPTVGRHILMTKTDFSQFTQVSPDGAPGPSQAPNPIIGRDPTKSPQAGDPPGVTVSLGSLSASGNFLFDTGAAASMISTSIASSLHVRYVAGTKDTENPQLELFDPGHPGNPGTYIAGQFTLPIGGIGGSTTIAGFYLDNLMLPTQEGLSNPNNNINFRDAPVLVSDISVVNPSNHSTLTLDGVFGMNLIEPSAFVVQAPGDFFPTIGALTPSAFNYITYQQDYDSTHSMLGLDINPNPPVANPLDWVPFESTEWNRTDINWIDISDPNFFAAYQDGRAVVFNDSPVLTDVFTIYISDAVSPSDVQIIANGNGLTFLAGAGITGTCGLTKSGTKTATFFNSNSYTGLTDIQQGTLAFNARQNIGAVLVRAGGHLVMRTSQTFAGLNMDGGDAVLTAGGNKVLVLSTLLVSGNGKLDINDNKMILDSTAMSKSDLRDMLRAGYNNGAWNGIGLTSSSDAASSIRDSIGFIDNRILHLTQFGGETVTDDALLVKSTYAGDANMDGMVDLMDVYSLALNWQTIDSYWYEGDFNYDGSVDARDLTILAHNWQAGVGNPLPGDSLSPILNSFGLPPTAVPEPAALGTIALFIAVGGSRRLRTSIKRL